MPTVLIVDDEALIRWSLGEHLADDGYEVRLAGTGRDARVEFETRPDAVVMDVRLPDADGLSLMEELHRSCPDCPVVVISAHAGPDFDGEARARGAYGFFHKPFDLGALTRMLAGALAARP